MRFDTLLIANRGEIAVRIARTARRMGLRTVAVHSEADAGSAHVKACDDAVAIGPSAAASSYLSIPRILDAATRAGAGAVHPGYGFLAENAAFARACGEAGLTFVGPSPAAIAAMGDKAAAKRLMRAAGVPVVPGYDGEAQDDARLVSEAATIGYPLMVKAAAGGGGKGMRLVADADGLPGALAAARREARSAFGSDALLLERAVLRPRHVEIQVLADAHGRCLHLGERDCSVQRRHQKVLEESPSPAVDAALRARMGAAGVDAARAVDYEGAGTVEFLLDADGGFYFLEMNTRLQVEHPVTEMVTGLDLVELQLGVAQGEPLPIRQEDVTFTGHAIEARLYAEDPASDYLPATGPLLAWAPAAGPGVRVDAGVQQGDTITPYYDPMIAKVIAHGADRQQARTRLLRALTETTALGTTTNRTMLIATLSDPTFASGKATTALLSAGVPVNPTPGPAQLAAIAAARYDTLRRDAACASRGLAGWASTGALSARWRWQTGETEHRIVVTERRDGICVKVDDQPFSIQLGGDRPTVDGTTIVVRLLAPEPGRLLAAVGAHDLEIRDLGALPPGPDTADGAGILLAPMHGRVIAVEVAVGDPVTAGQRLLVLEAMKMEHELVADVDGRVTEIASADAQVVARQLVVLITAAPEVADGA